MYTETTERLSEPGYLEIGFALTYNNKKSINRLQLSQNKALRIALRSRWRARIKELHERAMVPTMATHLQSLMKSAIKRYGNSKLMQELHHELDRIY